MKKQNVLLAFIRNAHHLTKGKVLELIFESDQRGQVDPALNAALDDNFESLGIDKTFLVSDYTKPRFQHTNIMECLLLQIKEQLTQDGTSILAELRDYLLKLLGAPTGVVLLDEKEVALIAQWYHSAASGENIGIMPADRLEGENLFIKKIEPLYLEAVKDNL